MPEPNLFQIFITRLNKMGVRYMVTGAVAEVVYGEPVSLSAYKKRRVKGFERERDKAWTKITGDGRNVITLRNWRNPKCSFP